MSKKHGAVKCGRRTRRGNNTGSLYQKPGGGTYYMRFTERTPEGTVKRVVWSTGTDDLEQARAKLEAKQRELGFGLSDEAHVDRLLTARRNIDNERLRLDKERAAAEAKAQRQADEEAALERDRNAVTFAEAFALYRASRRRPDSGEVTLAHYEGQYNRFAAWIREKHPDVTRLRDVTPDIAEAFVDEIERTLSRNTRNKYLVFLRMFWRVLRWEPNAQLTIDPWDGIRNLVQTPDEIVHKELTVEELARIATVIRSGEPLPVIRKKVKASGCQPGGIKDAFTYNGESIRDEIRRLFAIGIYLGQRLGDCAMLDWSEVDLVRGIVHLAPRKTKRKYNREVIVPVHPVLAAILAEIPAKRRRGPVLPHLAEMYASSDTSLSRRLLAIMRKAGIETDASGENGTRTRTVAGFHSLRHTFSSVMLNAGVSPAFVDAMLCHAKGTMTMRYFHEHAEALASAVAKLPAIRQLTDGRHVPQLAQGCSAQGETIDLPSEGADASCGVLDAFRAAIGAATADLTARASGEDLARAAKALKAAAKALEQKAKGRRD